MFIILADDCSVGVRSRPPRRMGFFLTPDADVDAAAFGRGAERCDFAAASAARRAASLPRLWANDASRSMDLRRT